MLMMRMVVKTLTHCTWLIIMAAMLTSTQPTISESRPPVLDTAGNPLEAGAEYFILPSRRCGGGPLALVSRNELCPLFVGQENDPSSPRFPVVFKPFVEGEKVVREFSDFRVQFASISICIQSTQWKVVSGEKRRLIGTGGGEEAASFFRIEKNESDGGYNLGWCPTDVCPLCRFDCGKAGVLMEKETRLLALDDVPVLSVVFKRA
ncbi:alpha-amylase/subtilisin inhibitor-like [Carica papaya]|uniref:alpha-amylase/subtilisin inhibitor-like n=1 Tax=Carica papaya TaxID=3649 RepID=UPI000B8CFC21|nr:alpha-amylase/subtilisin inhibitor-like [Carica papaya]